MISGSEGKQSVLLTLALARKICFETEQKNNLCELRKIIFCTEIKSKPTEDFEECSGKWWGRDLNRVWPLMVQLWWSVFSQSYFIQKPEEPSTLSLHPSHIQIIDHELVSNHQTFSGTFVIIRVCFYILDSFRYIFPNYWLTCVCWLWSCLLPLSTFHGCPAVTNPRWPPH